MRVDPNDDSVVETHIYTKINLFFIFLARRRQFILFLLNKRRCERLLYRSGIFHISFEVFFFEPGVVHGTTSRVSEISRDRREKASRGVASFVLEVKKNNDRHVTAARTIMGAVVGACPSRGTNENATITRGSARRK